MQYVRTIDGLRAIAVLPVVLFHAEVPGTRGGFIGVDIFFVISGFLITRSILVDIERGTFSILQFYERRIRRIAPAMMFVLGLTCVAALLMLTPERLVPFAGSLRASLFMYANIHFAALDGYFDHASDEQLLIHFWSLAVEEQFYLFFPLALLLFNKWLPTYFWYVIALAWAGSFLLATYSPACTSSSGCFYSTQTRAWELLSGALLVPLSQFLLIADNKRIADAACICGCILIGWSYLTFGTHIQIPGPWILVPVAGTCMIILFGQNSPLAVVTIGGRLPVAIGLISYSLYLWHQPIMALARIKAPGLTPAWLTATLIAVSILLAWLTYKYVECPWRDRHRTSKRLLLTNTVIISAVLLATASVSISSIGFPNRFSGPDYSASARNAEHAKTCSGGEKLPINPKDACTYFSGPVTWAVIGDSHGIELAQALGERLQPFGEAVLQLTHSGCPPAFGSPLNPIRCASWHEPALQRVLFENSVTDVVLAFRHVAYTESDRHKGFSVTWRDTVSEYFAESSSFIDHTSYLNAYWLGFTSAVERLQLAGKRVHILWPVPELPADFLDLAQPFSVFSSASVESMSQIVAVDEYLERNKQILPRLEELANNSASHYIDPRAVFCTTDTCTAVLEGEALYYDDDHVSVAGAHRLISYLFDYYPSTRYRVTFEKTELMH